MIDFFAGDLHHLTERVAYMYWERRGRPFGSPEVDWAAAEKALASSFKHREIPLYDLQTEPYEGRIADELLRSQTRKFRQRKMAGDWHNVEY
jgi:hypothetical protein